MILELYFYKFIKNHEKYINTRMEGRNMNEIVFVTHNKGKIAEAQKVLKNIKLEIFEHERLLRK